MGIRTKLVACIKYLHISLSYLRFLGKLVTQQFLADLDIALEQPAHKSQGKHILGTQDGFIIQSAFFQAFLTHCCDSCLYHFVLDT